MKSSVIIGIAKGEDVVIDYQITSDSTLCKFETNGMVEDIYAFLPIRKKDIDAFEDAIVKSNGYIKYDDIIKYIKLFGGKIITGAESRLIIY